MHPFEESRITGRIAAGALAEAVANPNEGPVHKGIRERLTAFANGKGFTNDFDLGPGPDGVRLRPDVCLANGEGAVLVGDAKDSRTERAGHFKPWLRVSTYFEAVLRLLDAGRIRSFYFLVATDNREAAEEWARGLDRLGVALRVDHKNSVWELQAGTGVWVVN